MPAIATVPPNWRASPHPICIRDAAAPRGPGAARWSRTVSPMPSSHADLRNPVKRELLLRRKIRTCLAEWAHHALAPLGQVPAAHHRLLIAELEALTAGTIDRLMVLMPPGAAKSTYASVLFPAWWFVRRPRTNVIAAAHTADLAAHFAGRVRNLIDEHAPQLGYRIAPGARAGTNWRTSDGGTYYATGVHGHVVGRRADLVLIDDPVKSQAEADSPALREQLWNWYRFDLTTRLKPGGRVLLIMTRWHEDDLGGRLLDSGESWRCLRLPALAEPDDPLGRAPGTPLWPDWEDATALARKRTAIGERAWTALYQQNPRPIGGTLFKAIQIGAIEAAPALLAASVRAWDLAASSQVGATDPDWTVGLKLAREPTGRFVVLDVVRLRGGPHDVERAIVNTAEQDGRVVPVALPQDPGQAGRAQILYLTSRLAGFHVAASPETGAKQTRAMPAAAQVDAGNVVIVRAAWNRAFLDELRDFPHGRKDDQVDALARAFAHLTETAAPSRRLKIPLMQR